MIPDPLTFAHAALGCARTPRRSVEPLGYCRTHDSCHWPCPEAVRVAALIEARDREIRADECEQAAALVRARVTADNANLGPNGRSLERRAIAKALRERATQHRTEGDTNG